MAKTLGTTPRTIARWLEEGMPIKRRGRGGRPSLYSLVDVRKWLKERDKAAAGSGPASSAQQARAQRDYWDAQVKQQTYEMRQRKLLPAEEVEEAWSAILGAVRAQLLLIPQTYAERVHRLARTSTPAAVKHLLEEAVSQALAELAGAKIQSPAKKTRGARPAA